MLADAASEALASARAAAVVADDVSAMTSASARVGTIDAAVTSDNVTVRMRSRRHSPDMPVGFVGFIPASL